MQHGSACSFYSAEELNNLRYILILHELFFVLWRFRADSKSEPLA
jgi:hypothetical protein